VCNQFILSMKYYETHYEEYIQSVKAYNIHPELEDRFRQFPETIQEVGNIILYGPSGSGKYSQLLYLLERYSPSRLKYDKKITVQTEKQSYIYRISDIHYEIDMALLGCHSRPLWHEVFFQIVDILSVKPDKTGIIVCKNFHTIHSELLEVFYSYIQHSKAISSNIHIRFILLTEHISFIPNNILNCCEKIGVSKPTAEILSNMLTSNSLRPMEFQGNMESEAEAVRSKSAIFGRDEVSYENPRTPTASPPEYFTTPNSDDFLRKIVSKRKLSDKPLENAIRILRSVDPKTILNLKEIQSFTAVNDVGELPNDVFNIICDHIIQRMEERDTLEFADFREKLYDILIYNLDITECLWYIFRHFIQRGCIPASKTPEILSRIYVFLKYYNNNYRPIYHLESIFFYLLLQLDVKS
jgi:hypothetical protein